MRLKIHFFVSAVGRKHKKCLICEMIRILSLWNLSCSWSLWSFVCCRVSLENITHYIEKNNMRYSLSTRCHNILIPLSLLNIYTTQKDISYSKNQSIISIPYSQVLPDSAGLERGRQQERLPEGVLRRTVGPRRLSQRSAGQRRRHHHLQAGPDLEPHQLCVWT